MTRHPAPPNTPPAGAPPAGIPPGIGAGTEGARLYGRPLSRRWRWLLAGYGALMALAAVGALLVGSGTLTSTELVAALAWVQQPYLEVAALSRGQDAQGSAEYVVFLKDDAPATALQDFLASHRNMAYLSDGILPGIKVVRVSGDTEQGLNTLRAQPFAQMVLKSRVGMFCH